MVTDTKTPQISDHCAVRLHNFIVIFGGRSGPVLSTRGIWTYNLYTDKWEKHVIPKKRKAPQPFVHAVAETIEGTIYTFGGSSTIHNGFERNTLWTLSRTETGDFSWGVIKYQGDKKSPSPRTRHTGWEYAGKLWVFGGKGPSPKHYLNDDGDIANDVVPQNNQLLCYYPHTQKWANPKCFGEKPSPRSSHCTTIIREKVWLFGGYNEKLACLSDFFQLNMHSLTWMRIQTGRCCPAARCGYTLTATADDRLILHGRNCTWIMDLTSYSWRRYTSGKHHARYDHTATLGLNSNVIAIGGYRAFEVYNEIFHVILEPMTLQKLAAHMIFKHPDLIAWKSLPKKLINVLGISDKEQDAAASFIEHSTTTSATGLTTAIAKTYGYLTQDLSKETVFPRVHRLPHDPEIQKFIGFLLKNH